MSNGLSIRRIELHDFRSYDHLDLPDVGDLTVLVGPNAVGKTNLIEAIQLLTAQTSFRHPTTEQLVRTGRDVARAESVISDGERRLDVALRVEEGHKRYTLNGKGKHAVDLKGILPSVTFTPDDLGLAKGSMSRRREVLDALGSQLTANHYLIKRDFEKVLRHKNRLLKDGGAPALLDSVDEMMVTCGAQLAAYRAALFEKTARHMARHYECLADGRERLEACYVPSWRDVEEDEVVSFTFGRDEARRELEAALGRVSARERECGRCLVGPQRDRVEFFLDGLNVSHYASQGQQRSVVLSWKLAEASVMRDMLQQSPVLLLDDVMSELDDARRRALVDLVLGDSQAFVTTTTLEYFDDDLLSKAQVTEMGRGGL